MLESLRLNNFRNHQNFSTDFKKINYILGNNGSGKTSIIEAINVALQGKSFKNIYLKQLINFNSNFFRIEANLKNKGKVVFFYDNKKNLKLNNSNIKSMATHILNFPVFTYSPENEGFLSLTQLHRRNFLDKIVFYIFNEHLEHLKNYNKLLKIKKNLLLSKNIDLNYLETINNMLIENNNRIQKLRQVIINKINSKIGTILKKFTNLEQFSLKYLKSDDNFDFDKEINKKKILFGSHLDKIKYYYNDLEYEKFSSFGQRKSFSLICLNACFLTVEENLKNDIIFLLDDFEAGLDVGRIHLFKELFSSHQIIITGVSNIHFKDANIIKI